MSYGERQLTCDKDSVSDGRNKVVLIIDDDEGIRFLAKFAIERSGYKVFIASNGQEGLNLLGTIPRPGIILLDLMMPIMDGWSFLDEIESDARWRKIPVVVLTAFPVESNSVRGKQIVNKPVELRLLLQAVQSYCQ